MHFIHKDGLSKSDSQVRDLNGFMQAYRLAISHIGMETQIDLGWFLTYAGVFPFVEEAYAAIDHGRVTVAGSVYTEFFCSTSWLAGKRIMCDGRTVLYGPSEREGEDCLEST